MRELIITIDETTGELHVDIKGYVGAACDEVSRLVEEVMGRPAEQTRLKPEYHVRPAPQVRPGGRRGAPGGGHG